MHARRRAAGTLLIGALLLAGCAGTPTAGTPAVGGDSGDGIPASPGWDPETRTITVGSLVPVSGVFTAAYSQVQGGEAAFARATAAGGPLEGYTVDLVNFDSQYNASVAVPLYQSNKDNVLLFQSIIGAPIVNALLPALEDDDMLAVPGLSTEDFVTDPNILPFGPIQPTYAAAAVDYASSELGLDDGVFCSMTSEDESGEAYRRGFRFALDETGRTAGADATYPVGGEEFTSQVTKLKNAGCDLVFLTGSGAVLQNTAVEATQLDFPTSWVVPASAILATTSTGPAADYIIDHVHVLMTGTEWNGTQAPGQRQMQDDLEALFPGYTPYANSYQTGYLSSTVVIALLERAIADRDLSRAHLVELAAELGDVDDLGMGGGTFHYGQQLSDRRPNTALSVFRVDPASPIGLTLQEFQYASPLADAYNRATFG